MPADSRLAVPVGLASTLIAVVASDVITGASLLHTLSISLIVLAVAAVQLLSTRLVGDRRRSLFALINAAVILQPVAHATAKLLPGPGQPTGSLHHLPADAPITAVHLVVALLVVGMVVNVERLVLLGAAMLVRVVQWLIGAPAGPVETVRRVVEVRAPQPARTWVCYLVRRGPPGISPSPAY